MRHGRRGGKDRRTLLRGDLPRASLAVLMGWSQPDDGPATGRACENVARLSRGLPPLMAVRGAVIVLLWLTAALEGQGLIPSVGVLGGAGALLIEGTLAFTLRRFDPEGRRPWRQARLATAAAVASGVAWALLLHDAPGATAAAIALAVLALAPVPAAAVGHALGIAAAAAILHPTVGLIGGGAVALAGIAFLLYREAAGTDLAERAASGRDRLTETARGLLADFEESGKGWFWETDAEGQLTYVSPRLTASLGVGAEALIGTPLTALFRDESATEGENPRGERTVGFHLSARFAFSDVVVRAGLEEPRWWSLSGRPATDQYGSFSGFRGSGTDLTEMMRSEAEVSRLARYDALTGLPNRVLMRNTLEAALKDADGHNHECALILLDLDRFKWVNDTLGHPVGDTLLRQVSERLLGVVGEIGRVGRLGGDEFKVVVPHVRNRQTLATFAEEVIARISQPYVVDGVSVSIGASAGIAVGPIDGDCPDSLVRNADLALYAAKADGKGIHRFYEAGMHATAKDRRQLEEDLRNALGSNHGFELAFQPIVNATSEEIVGFEALSRWTHPTRGPVSPALFIPLAEEIGLIWQIGEWVIRTACKEAAKWPGSARVAVNISPIQFANPALPAIVMSALAEAQLAPKRLELEITEGVFMNDGAATDTMFARLAAVGVRFALDDFGTGYSSLGYLKKAPFNKIKIDQSFVRGAAVPGSRNAAIIRAIVTLAESLGMETTAEGAETHDELDLIRSLGCSQIQGYVFGRPMSAEEAHARLSSGGRIEADGYSNHRAPRIAVLRSALIGRDGGPANERIRLRNISDGGAMAETERDLPQGCAVEIQFPDGERIAGEVRWSETGRCGIQFRQSYEMQRPATPPRPRLQRHAAQ